MRRIFTLLVVLILSAPAGAQFPPRPSFQRINRRLAGTVVDYTNNHGRDRRIFSPVLGQWRDLYVYLPPGYDPRHAYPLVVFLHMALVDQRSFLDPRVLEDLDDLILRGEIPPIVLACPDGNYGENDTCRKTHSFFLNGQGGRFEDHILDEVIPFVDAHYAIRPGRESHGFLGISAGGLGGMSMAIRHRDRIGAVATIESPLNLRYSNVAGDHFEDFDPYRYRWKPRYNPNEFIARYFHGLLKTRARRMISPVFGEDEETVPRIIAINPADLLFTSGLQPGELPMYVNYSGLGEWNFDAQDESFAWLAACRGIGLTLVKDPSGHHDLRYFHRSIPLAILWLGWTLR